MYLQEKLFSHIYSQYLPTSFSFSKFKHVTRTIEEKYLNLTVTFSNLFIEYFVLIIYSEAHTRLVRLRLACILTNFSRTTHIIYMHKPAIMNTYRLLLELSVYVCNTQRVHLYIKRLINPALAFLTSYSISSGQSLINSIHTFVDLDVRAL